MKQDVEADTATAEVDWLNVPPKYSSDNDIGDSNVTVFFAFKKQILHLKFYI